jgi:alkanesulfonate monooxygenase SsuD/methylene tetrahydromethanopterin reductase-like flavin-dependent oxidoreductase (luciferase family)
LNLDASLAPASLRDVPSVAAAAEALGFDAVWTSETQHHPFLSLAPVAEHTARLGFGSAVAIGFARSPTVLAHTAWDLAAVWGGRFRLALT